MELAKSLRQLATFNALLACATSVPITLHHWLSDTKFEKLVSDYFWDAVVVLILVVFVVGTYLTGRVHGWWIEITF